MTVNSAELLVPSRAHVYLAEVGTVAPADSVIAMGVGWKNVGLTKEDSLSFSTEPTFEDVTSHQSDYPVRTFQTGETAAMAVDLQQWNSANLKAVFGGGTVTEVGTAGSGNFKFVPPALGGRTEKSCIIEVIDGGKHYRWVYPRVMQKEGVQSELGKGAEARLPLRFTVLGDDGGEPWYLLTDDPAFDPAAV